MPEAAHQTDPAHGRISHLAAVLYRGTTDIDGLMASFLAELAANRQRVAGVVQVAIPGRVCGPNAPMLLRDLATGEVLTISQDLGSGAQSCRLDSAALADAAVRVRHAVEAPDVDLVVISKFGKEEAAGRGLREEMALAAANGRPVLTTLRRNLSEDWVTFTGDPATILEPTLASLRSWWASVAPPAVRAA